MMPLTFKNAMKLTNALHLIFQVDSNGTVFIEKTLTAEEKAAIAKAAANKACIEAGYTSCENKEAEEACKSRGFTSCAIMKKKNKLVTKNRCWMTIQVVLIKTTEEACKAAVLIKK